MVASESLATCGHCDGGDVCRDRVGVVGHIAVVVHRPRYVELSLPERDVRLQREYFVVQCESAAEIRWVLRLVRRAGDSQPSPKGVIRCEAFREPMDVWHPAGGRSVLARKKAWLVCPLCHRRSDISLVDYWGDSLGAVPSTQAVRATSRGASDRGSCDVCFGRTTGVEVVAFLSLTHRIQRDEPRHDVIERLWIDRGIAITGTNPPALLDNGSPSLGAGRRSTCACRCARSRF